MKKIIVLALTLVAASLSVRAQGPVVPLLTLNASGTIDLVKTNITKYVYVKSEAESNGVMTVIGTMKSFNNAFIYQIISNAVAEGQVDGVPATNLPANGFIAFNLEKNDSGSNNFEAGTFYVTNKFVGWSYALSGHDAGGSYYSYIELDSYQIDFDQNFNDVETGSLTENEDSEPISAAVTETGMSLFYVHDNPYAYDDADSPRNYENNDNAIEIRCNIQASIGLKNSTAATVIISSTGGAVGNVMLNDEDCVLTAGKVSLAK
jgi:hypothetical protein